VLPDYRSTPLEYADALIALVEQHSIDVVVPCQDGSIEAVRTRRGEIERRAALAMASEAALSLVIDKRRTLALASKLGLNVPVSLEVRDRSDLRAALKQVGFPAVLKPIWSWAVHSGNGSRLSPVPASSFDEALKALEVAQLLGGQVIVQPWLPGRRDAVTVMYTGGAVRARFVQTSHRELPLLGGASVLYESIPPLPDIVEPAERLVRTLNLEGCSMVEFRRDIKGTPFLMEVNPRMGGSVSLAAAAGINFPLLVRSWALGLTVPEQWEYATGVRRRWLFGDIESLKEGLRPERQADAPSRAACVMTFFADFLRRPASLEVFDSADMRPWLLELDDIRRAGMKSAGKIGQRLLGF
jgi:predicted ATP-grasp superfamily ATP-dependent carboligase